MSEGTLSMVELKGRFAHRPLVPNDLVLKQSEWRQRWGLQPRPVHPESTSWDYHIDVSGLVASGPNNPWARLRYSLLHDDPESKYFLTGTKGAGKSTTVNSLWLDDDVRARFHLLGFSITDYLNPAEADAGQIIAVLIAHAVEAVRDSGRAADLGDASARSALKDLEKVLKKALPGVTLGGVDLKLFGLMTAKFKESRGAREAFRDFMDGQPEAVFSLLDSVLAVLSKANGDKPVLVVVDDLDKLSDADAKDDVFQRRLSTLLRPRCAALYTFPLELHRNPRYDHLKAQPNRFKLGNVKLYASKAAQEEQEILDEGRVVLHRFIESRLDDAPVEAYLDDALLDCIFRYACGNFRELTRILQHAFQTAGMLGRPRADKACVEAALKQLRDDYNPFLRTYAGALQAVVDNHRGDEREDIDAAVLSPLIQSLAIVEYPNDPGWDDVHPIIRDLLNDQPSGC